MSHVIHVAAAAITNDQNEVLLSLRDEHVHQGGLWEFPGGKLETGESVYDALVRELDEELGIQLKQAQPLIKIQHTYEDCVVLLDVWRVLDYLGEPHGREQQPVKWQAIDTLDASMMPAADVSIIHALQLPDHYLITPQPDENISEFLQQLGFCLQSGIRLIQLRAPHLSDTDYQNLALDVKQLTQRHQARLMINHSLEMFEHINADGLHLTASQLLALKQRPVPDKNWLSASCHNQQELEQAHELNVDFVMLSPVLPTKSHPGAATLGWKSFQALAEKASMPVYALGGMTPEMMSQAKQNGAQGIAGIRSLWKSGI